MITIRVEIEYEKRPILLNECDLVKSRIKENTYYSVYGRLNDVICVQIGCLDNDRSSNIGKSDENKLNNLNIKRAKMKK